MGKVQKKHEYPEHFINNNKFIGTKENIASILLKTLQLQLVHLYLITSKIEMTTACFCHQLMKMKFIRLLKAAKTKAQLMQMVLV